MYYSVNYRFTGNCPDIDVYETLESGELLVSEDLNDAIPYLYEKHFGIPYNELGWWLEPGAKEFIKDLEDKWFHNQLDLSEVYKDPEFLSILAQKYSDKVDEETIDNLKDEFEDILQDELNDLDEEDLKELHDYSDSVYYTIEDDDGNEIAFGHVYLPELEEDEEDED